MRNLEWNVFMKTFFWLFPVYILLYSVLTLYPMYVECWMYKCTLKHTPPWSTKFVDHTLIYKQKWGLWGFWKAMLFMTHWKVISILVIPNHMQIHIEEKPTKTKNITYTALCEAKLVCLKHKANSNWKSQSVLDSLSILLLGNSSSHRYWEYICHKEH